MNRRAEVRELAEELVLMAEKYRAVRAYLSAECTLLDSHPIMADLQRRNAERLNTIMDAVGWPGRNVIGAAAWAPMLLLQNATGSLSVMHRGLGLIRAAERRGEVDPVYVAWLEDRVLTMEGKPQQYGTELDRDDDGELSPLPIADPEDVDVRRRAVGLDSLAEDIERIRAEARRDSARPPAALASRKEAAEAWAQSVGWRE